jgi:Tetratricopeptide repeat
MIKTFTLTVILFIICFSSRVHSQDDKVQPSKRSILGQSSSKQEKQGPWIGKRVVQRYRNIEVEMDGNKGWASTILMGVVSETEKTRLRVRVGCTGLECWVRAEDVVPLTEAIAFFSREIQIRPRGLFGYYMRSGCLRELGMYRLALNDINIVISLSQNSSSSYNLRGRLWQEIQEYDNAIADLNYALKIASPDQYSVVLYARSDVLADMKEYDKSIADASESIQFDQTQAAPYASRGRAWAGKKDYAKALADFDKAIEVNPYFVDAYYWRGHTFSTMDQKDKAIADYKKAVHLDPSHAKAKHELHNLLFSLFPPQNPRL